MVQVALTEMIGVSQFLEQNLIFLLPKIDFLAIYNQISCLFFFICCACRGKNNQRKEAENERYQFFSE